MSDLTNPIDNPTSEESTIVTPPSVGSLTEVKTEEMLIPKPIKEKIKNISTEVNAQVKKAISIEDKKEITDKQQREAYDELLEFEREEDEYTPKSNFKLLFGLAVLAVGTGYSVMKHKHVKEQDLEQLLHEESHKETQVNKSTGMFE